MPFQRVSIDRMNLGINKRVNPSELKATEAVDILNMEWGLDDDLKTRRGAKAITSTSATVTKSGQIVNGEIDNPWWFESDGSYLYVANRDSDSITVYDISVRARTHLIGSISSSTYLNAVAGMYLDTTNDVLYAVSSQAGGGNYYVNSIDVSDPENPVFLDNYTHANFLSLYDCEKVGNYLYVTSYGNDKLFTLNVTTPSAITFTHELTDAVNLNGAHSVIQDETGSSLWVTGHVGGSLTHIDLTTPTAPAVTGTPLVTLANLQYATKLAYSEDLSTLFVCAAPSNNGGRPSLVACSVSTKNSPTYTSRYDIAAGTAGASTFNGDVQIVGYRAYYAGYVADYAAVLDVSDPAAILEDNVLESNGTANSVSIYYAESYLWIGSEENDIIDVYFVDPGYALSEWDSLQQAATSIYRAATIYGNYAYVVDQAADTMWIYDISDKSAISLESTTTDATDLNFPNSVHVWTDGVDTYAAILDQATPKLQIWNVTNPSLPYHVSSTASFGTGAGTCRQYSMTGYWISGEYYIVIMIDTSATSSNEMMRVYEATSPETTGVSLRSKLLNPDPSGTFSNPAARGPQWLNGDYMVVFNQTPDWFHLYDMRDPDNPAVLSSFQRNGAASLGYCGHPTDDYFYIGTGAVDEGIEVWSVADKTNPTYIHTIHIGAALAYEGMFCSGDLIWGHDGGNDTVHAVRITNREWPVRVAQYSSANTTTGPLMQYGQGTNPSYDSSENVLWCLDVEAATFSITAIDTRGIADTYLAQTLDDVKLEGINALRKTGQYMYVASYDSDALSVLDVNNAEAMIQVAYLADAVNLNGFRDLEFSEDGKYLYAVAETTGGLSVIDIQDPKHPYIRDSITHASLAGASAVAVRGTFAYVASTSWNGVSVVDCTNPDALAVVGSLQDATNLSGPFGIAAWATDTTTFYCAVSTSDRVTVLNVSTPGSITVADTFTDANYSGGRRLRKDGDYVYATAYTTDYVFVLDVSTPTAITESDSITHADISGPWDLWVDSNNGRVAVASADSDEVVLISSEDLTALAHLKTFTDARLDTPYAVWSTGSSVFVGGNVSNNIMYLSMSGFPLTNRVTSIFQFRTTDGTLITLVTSGSDIFQLDQTTGVLTAKTGALELPYNTMWDWVSYDGIAIGCNGGGTSKANPVYWDGTGSFADLVDAPNEGKFVELWNDRIIIADKTAVNWSDLGDPLDWTDPILSGALETDSDYDAYITGLASHRGYLVVFKQNNVYRVISGAPATNSDLWSVENIVKGHGCISGYTVRTVLDDILFLSKEGVIALGAALQVGDFQSVSLSRNIPELRGLSLNRDDYAAFLDPVNSQYHLSVSLDGTAGNTIVYVFDFGNRQEIGQPRWTTFDGDFIGASYASILSDNNDPIVLIGGEDGTVYQRKLASDTNPYQDSSGAFTQYYISPEINYGLPFKRKKVNRWGLSLRKINPPYTLALKVELFFNGESSAAHTYNLSLASTEESVEVIRKLVGARGNTVESIQMKVSCVAADQPYRLDHIFTDTNAVTFKRMDDA